MSDHFAITYGVDLIVRLPKKPDCYVFQYKHSDIESFKMDMTRFCESFLTDNPFGKKCWPKLELIQEIAHRLNEDHIS